MSDHKYIWKEQKNGKWVYYYDEPAPLSKKTLTKSPVKATSTTDKYAKSITGRTLGDIKKELESQKTDDKRLTEPTKKEAQKYRVPKTKIIGSKRLSEIKSSTSIVKNGEKMLKRLMK